MEPSVILKDLGYDADTIRIFTSICKGWAGHQMLFTVDDSRIDISICDIADVIRNKIQQAS